MGGDWKILIFPKIDPSKNQDYGEIGWRWNQELKSAPFSKKIAPQKRPWFTGVEATLWKMDKNGTEIDPKKMR